MSKDTLFRIIFHVGADQIRCEKCFYKAECEKAMEDAKSRGESPLECAEYLQKIYKQEVLSGQI